MSKKSQSSKTSSLTSQHIAEIAAEALDDMKGQSITSINVEKVTSITDVMVICTGTSSTHIKALADEVTRNIKDAGGQVNGVEGKVQAEWVLVDLGGAVVHIMTAPVRALYNLEELWDFQPDDNQSEDATEES